MSPFSFSHTLVLCSAFLLQVSNDVVRPGAEAREAQPQPASAGFPEGLWPSDKLMNLVLLRWTEALSDQFELTDEQRAEIRQRIPKRWAEFLNEHRASLQPLVNEYLELHMELQPPTRDQVRDWAGRALPVFERLRIQFDKGLDDFRDVLQPSQRADFEAKALELTVGMRLAGQKLKQWRESDFDPRDFWSPPGRVPSDRGDRSGMPVSKQPSQTGAAGTPVGRLAEDKIEQELHAWDRFVSDYMRDHAFNLGQQTAARSCLQELKGRALDHRDRFREEIRELEKQIRNNSGTERELTEIKEKLVRLYGPVDALFAELKHRIEQIATSAQRGPEPSRKAD